MQKELSEGVEETRDGLHAGYQGHRYVHCAYSVFECVRACVMCSGIQYISFKLQTLSRHLLHSAYTGGWVVNGRSNSSCSHPKIN